MRKKAATKTKPIKKKWTPVIDPDLSSSEESSSEDDQPAHDESSTSSSEEGSEEEEDQSDCGSDDDNDDEESESEEESEEESSDGEAEESEGESSSDEDAESEVSDSSSSSSDSDEDAAPARSKGTVTKTCKIPATSASTRVQAKKQSAKSVSESSSSEDDSSTSDADDESSVEEEPPPSKVNAKSKPPKVFSRIASKPTGVGVAATTAPSSPPTSTTTIKSKVLNGKVENASLSPRKSPSLRKLKVVIKPLAYKGPHSPRKRPLTPGKKRRGVLRISAAKIASSSGGVGSSPNPRTTIQRQRVSFSEDGNDLNLVPRVEDKAACFYTKADLRRFELDRKAEKQAEQLQNLEQMMAQASLIMSGIPML